MLSLADLLREKGYTTAAFTPMRFLRGVSKGFDHLPLKEYHSAPGLLRRASKWLANRPEGEKLFVWVHLYDVHEWQVRGRRSEDDYWWMKNEEPTRKQLWKYLQQENGLRDTEKWERSTLLDRHHRYDAQIRWVDRELGRFFESQNAARPASPTARIVTADHSEGLGNHGIPGHGREVYREQLHVPLIFHFTAGSVEQGRRIDTRVRLVDLGPTIADLVGGDFENRVTEMVGTSLLPLLKGTGEWQESPIFAQRRPPDRKRLDQGWPPGDVYSLQLKNKKVIVPVGDLELYDLATDPFELNNLFEAEPELAQRLCLAAERRFRVLSQHGRSVSGGEIPEEVCEELKALGYLASVRSAPCRFPVYIDRRPRAIRPSTSGSPGEPSARSGRQPTLSSGTLCARSRSHTRCSAPDSSCSSPGGTPQLGRTS